MTGFELYNKIHEVGSKIVSLAKNDLGLKHNINIDTFFERSNKGGHVNDIDIVYINVGCTEFAGLDNDMLTKVISLVVAHEVRHIWQIKNNRYDFDASLDMDWIKRPEEIDAEEYAFSFLSSNIDLILA